MVGTVRVLGTVTVVDTVRKVRKAGLSLEKGHDHAWWQTGRRASRE